MRPELLQSIRCPRCHSNVTISIREDDDLEIVSGILKCDSCNSEYKIENGMPFLYINDANWVSKAKEAEGWINYHKNLGIYDQTNVQIDFILPYFEGPWEKVSQMFNICLDILNLNGTEKILDIGAARGWAAKNFALKGCKCNAIDIISDDQIGLGRSKALIRSAGVYYERIIGDIENLPYKDKTYDVAFCSAVLHHTDKLPELIDNIYRVLDDGGILIAMNEPAIGIFQDENECLKGSEEIKYNINERRPTIIQYYDALKNAGFTDIRIFPYFLYKNSTVQILNWTSNFSISKEVDLIVKNFDYMKKNNLDSRVLKVMVQYGGEIIITARKAPLKADGSRTNKYGKRLHDFIKLIVGTTRGPISEG